MKTFNLERALAGDPVVTRDGRPVYDIYYSEIIDTDKYQVTGVLDGAWASWTSTGQFYTPVKHEHNNDLFMAPKEVTYWVNVYKSAYGVFTNNTYISEAAALAHKQPYYIKTISFTVEE